MSDLYTGVQAARVTGLTYRQVDHACRAGHVLPIANEEPGSGRQRGYALEDLVRLRLAWHLGETIGKGSVPWHLVAPAYAGPVAVGPVTVTVDLEVVRAEVVRRLPLATSRRPVRPDAMPASFATA